MLPVSHDTMKTMNGIRANFTLKYDKVEKPDIYLGTSLDKMSTDDRVECWTMLPEKYCKAAVQKVKKVLKDHVRRLTSKCRETLKPGYRPELDRSPELKADGVQYYQELIGMLLWAVEIVRIDILLEVSLMSTHLGLPLIEHLDHLYHVVGFPKEKPKLNLAFDPAHPQIFSKHNWQDFYRDAK